MSIANMTPAEIDAQVIADTNRLLLAQQPYPGMRVRHVKTGHDYRVTCVAKIEATLARAVVYRSDKAGQHWVRPLAEFCDGRFVGV